MKTSILNADNNIFLVEISYKSTDNTFLTTAENIGSILKKHNSDRRPVKIKIFDKKTASFKRVSKENLNLFCGWETESFLILKDYNLI